MSGAGTLDEYAATVLLGSGLSVEDAVALASGAGQVRGLVGVALRDGWRSADPARRPRLPGSFAFGAPGGDDS